VASLRGDLAAEDVAQDVKLRLWKELQAGKRYVVPYRVVVHQVIGWTVKDQFAGRDTSVPLPDGGAPGGRGRAAHARRRRAPRRRYSSPQRHQRATRSPRTRSPVPRRRVGLSSPASDPSGPLNRSNTRVSLEHGQELGSE